MRNGGEPDFIGSVGNACREAAGSATADSL